MRPAGPARPISPPLAMELVRDAASASYTVATGEVWTPWRGSVKASRTTAALIEARDAIRSAKARKHGAADPGATIVAFRASPMADTAEDANRIFDALNWAQGEWPDMALATTGAKGAEKLAIKWAKGKNVTLILAKADFDKFGRAAPFRANDEMLELDPVCVLTLAEHIEPSALRRLPALRTGAQSWSEGRGEGHSSPSHPGASLASFGGGLRTVAFFVPSPAVQCRARGLG